MKNFLLFLTFILSFNYCISQLPVFDGLPPEINTGVVSAGSGITIIDGEPFITFRLQPAISFDKWTIGLDVNLDYDIKNGKIRKENYDEVNDFLSMVRFIQYGEKIASEPFYARLGQLNTTIIGNGSIVYFYNNSPTFDNRRLGLNTQINFEYGGIDLLYGNFTNPGLVGGRVHLYPFTIIKNVDIPIIKDMQVGVTHISDLDQNASIKTGIYDSTNKSIQASQTVPTIGVSGFDLTFPLITSELFSLKTYYDFATISGFGSGNALGISTSVKVFDLLRADARVERRINGKGYVTSYFNALYEIERINIDPSTNQIRSKIHAVSQQKADNGIFGDLMLNFSDIVRIYGSYQELDNTPNSGLMRIGVNILPSSQQFFVRGGIDKVNVNSFLNEIFETNDRTFIYAEGGIRLGGNLQFSLLYQKTFQAIRAEDNSIIGYAPQERIEPRINLVYPFTF